jgi:hypothetical protein
MLATLNLCHRARQLNNFLSVAQLFVGPDAVQPLEAASHKRENESHSDQGVQACNGYAEIYIGHDALRRLELISLSSTALLHAIVSSPNRSRGRRVIVPASRYESVESSDT